MNNDCSSQEERKLTNKELFIKSLGLNCADFDLHDIAVIDAILTEADTADVERRTAKFDVLAKDFSCYVGKVGLFVCLPHLLHV